jgi:hypothetical protein
MLQSLCRAKTLNFVKKPMDSSAVCFYVINALTQKIVVDLFAGVS